VIADVQVTQVYENEGKRPLEAIYIFPASTRAAVYGMGMTVEAGPLWRKSANGRRPGGTTRRRGNRKERFPLEQQRPNVFQ